MMISAAGNCLSTSSKEGSGSPGGEERCLDSQLWHACAGGMVQMPQVNSRVFYFPQGQAEHAQGDVDFGANCCRLPPLVLCRVVAVKFKADPDTDEVYARIRLFPLRKDDPSADPDDGGGEGGGCFGDNGGEASEKPASFAKTLTQSDANNGGGFSVPRYCAETIFPRLDYSADPPVQTVLAKDVHGEVWKFRHIYRGTPRRHLLTTGWSTFVNQKRLVAGDSIVFLRTANGELCVGIRRASRGESSSQSGWNPVAGSCGYGGMGMGMGIGAGIGGRGGSGGGGGEGGGFLVEERKKGKGRGRVSPESVLESASLAAKGLGFEVVYYPRASTPEFCVRESAVRSAVRVQWTAGMRFKMAFETEDSSRISWFMGTISGVQVADPIRWPNSPWRLLQVTWDEPDLLQNVKRVSPWLVEVVSNMPSIQLMPFPPQKKKLRLPQHMDFPLESHHPHIAAFSGSTFRSSSPLQCIMDNSPAGIQGARHGQIGFSLSDLHLNKLQSGLFPNTRQHHGLGALSTATVSTELFMANSGMKDNVSCSLAIGVSSQSADKTVERKPAEFLLFGKPILRVTDPTKLGVSSAYSTGVDSSLLKDDCSADVKSEKVENYPVEFFDSDHPKPLNLSPCQGLSLLKECKNNEINLENGEYKKAFEDYAGGHCKVFMESENVGRTLDLSVICSYEDLHRRLADMFGIERREVLSNVLYRDASGVVKHTGEEPFSEFTKTARRLTILSDSSNLGK
ncbi:auxin response factor 18-like [Nymphaea colorata]|uniref:auxin response factor 18-like n=1 Tax=Nymphaea colorata TaxID=210225 RepID=UPI00129DA94B|nr:auxin response factor 18-like [Nymphaea colorata]